MKGSWSIAMTACVGRLAKAATPFSSPCPFHVQMFSKGYHALQAYRVAHVVWRRNQTLLALALQSRVNEVGERGTAADGGMGKMNSIAAGVRG